MGTRDTRKLSIFDFEGWLKKHTSMTLPRYR